MTASALKIARAIRAALFLAVLTLACVALSAAAYFGAAWFVDSPAAAGLVAAVVLLASTFVCFWWRAPGLGIRRERRITASSAAALAVLVMAVWAAGRVVLQPLDAALVEATTGAGSGAWKLPTGSTIAYTRLAAPSANPGLPLIYLHGGPAVPPRNTIREFLAPLAGEGFDVDLHDQFGSGASGRARDIAEYTVQRHVADLEAIRRELGADRIVLVGSSWGAVLAGYYMAAHPARVERAALLSPGVLTRRSEHP